MAKNDGAPGQGQMPPGLAMLIGQLGQINKPGMGNPQGGFGGINFGGLSGQPSQSQGGSLAQTNLPPPSSLFGPFQGPVGHFGPANPGPMAPQPTGKMESRPMPGGVTTSPVPPEMSMAGPVGMIPNNPMAPDMGKVIGETAQPQGIRPFKRPMVKRGGGY